MPAVVRLVFASIAWSTEIGQYPMHVHLSSVVKAVEVTQLAQSGRCQSSTISAHNETGNVGGERA